jgi:hypothetical protein
MLKYIMDMYFRRVSDKFPKGECEHEEIFKADPSYPCGHGAFLPALHGNFRR